MPFSNAPLEPSKESAKQSASAEAKSATGPVRTSNHAHIVQRARLAPQSLASSQVLQLQSLLGNRAVGNLLTGTTNAQPMQMKGNQTGLPDKLKAGIEQLSGFSMDDVNVHYNSSNPAQVGAAAYAQGTDIHVGAGQERHLPHEAWHVVQQKQGRVRPTIQMKNLSINDDSALEKEADRMGAKAHQVDS